MPTLGRALTDGNLNEVGFVNTFLQHLAQQSGTVEDDSDEDTKYEEEDDKSRPRRDYYHHHHYSPSFEDDDEDYYSRNKKRRTRWRANYPKIKKTKRTGDASSSSPSVLATSSSSFSRRRASVSTPSRAYTSAVTSNSMRSKEQRSNSVSSYFAMRNTEEEEEEQQEQQHQQSSPTLHPSPSAFGCDYTDPHLSSSPEQLQQQQRQMHQTHPLARADFEQPEWVTASSLPSCGGPDLPAVPSPPPLRYPIGLPSIQPLYPPNPHHHQLPAQQQNLQRSSSSPALLPPYSTRGPAAEYYSPQHQQHMPQQLWTVHAASVAMPPPAPILATNASSAMDEEVEVLESSSGQAPFDYATAQMNQATTPSQTEDEGSWLEDLLRLEHPSSAVDSSSFPTTPLSPSCPNHTHTGSQHPAASKDAAFYAELFGY
jgi:hypothetical protein